MTRPIRSMTTASRYPGRFVPWRCTAIAAILLVATGTRADVIGYDDRESPTLEERAALTGLGVLYPDGEPGSTAFLVSGCEVIVTAKHVVLDQNNRPRARHYVFHLGNDSEGIEVPFSGSRYGPGYDLTEDWIVMRLSEPVPDCKPIALLAPDDDALIALSGQFAVAGYQADREGALMVSRGCGIEPECQSQTRDSSVFTHNCDTFEGTSGAPVYVERPRGPVAIGINLAGAAFEATNICERSNLARRMSDAFYEAISEMAGDARLETFWHRRRTEDAH